MTKLTAAELRALARGEAWIYRGRAVPVMRGGDPLVDRPRDVLAAVRDLREAWEHNLKGWGADVKALHARIDELDVARQKAGMDTDRLVPAVNRRGRLLALEERAAPAFYARHGVEMPVREGQVRLGALLAAFAGPDAVRAQLSELEIRALHSGLTGPAGAYAVPEAIGAIFLDSIRPRSVCLQAGASTYAMEAQTVHLPGWDDPIAVGWRGETDALADGGGSFRRVTLSAKSCAAIVSVSTEQLEDAASGDLDSFAAIIEAELGRALAQELDRVMLLGNGTGNEPLGIYNTVGVSTVEMATNGATPTDWSKIHDALAAVETANFTPGALIYNPRTKRTLYGLATGIASDKTPLEPPRPINDVTHFVTGQLPNDLVWGSATNASAAITGDFTQLVLGVRPTMAVRVVTDPYTKLGEGLIRIAAWVRADVGVLNPPAFARVTGIKP